MMDCIFCKIARHEVPKEFTYEDADVMVFPDIHPLKPIHLLVVPKRHLVDYLDLTDSVLWNKLQTVAQKMIQEQKLVDKGYRITINGGGAQVIDHVHMHVVGPLGKDATM